MPWPRIEKCGLVCCQHAEAHIPLLMMTLVSLVDQALSLIYFNTLLKYFIFHVKS